MMRGPMNGSHHSLHVLYDTVNTCCPRDVVQLSTRSKSRSCQNRPFPTKNSGETTSIVVAVRIDTVVTKDERRSETHTR